MKKRRDILKNLNIKEIIDMKNVEKVLVNAKEAFESTKKPQLLNVIEKIDECRSRGKMYTYLDENKLHQETIEALLSRGYDISMKYFESMNHWSNVVYWDEKASGTIRDVLE